MKKEDLLILKDLVRGEAAKLRELATIEEINRLDFDILDWDDRHRCIYGQMTGDCFSDRAADLIIDCCDRVYTSGSRHIGVLSSSTLNGKPYPVDDRSASYFSPIERFLKESNSEGIENLVKYLKKEVDTLYI